MLQPATMKFLKGLAKNNNREWFDAHRDAYANARADFEQFAAAVMRAMVPLEPRLEEQQAKDTMFRIFRDVRFSKDKTPYKAHLSSYFSRLGRKWEGAGYYLHVAAGNVFVAAGIWMPQGTLLKALRQEIDYGYEEIRSILENKAFKKYFTALDGDQLQKVPAGYEPANPAAELLKMKSIIVSHKLQEEDLLAKDAVKKIVAPFTAAKPLVDFCNRALD
jgi:uncharacterized protein (TIGR02453 family)